jgi:rod shape-determining protein MreC
MNRRQKLSPKNIMIVLTLICIFLIVFTWETRDRISSMEKSIAYVVIPIQEGVDYFGEWVLDKVNFVKNINNLESMNEELLAEVDELRHENKMLQMDKVELKRLRQLYALDKRYEDYPKIGAKIIGKDPGNWYNIFLINKGSKDGLKVNMVVMANNGLAGRIIEVGPSYSKVKSIIDDTSSVSSKILRTSDLCAVKGDRTLINNSGAIRVEYIQSDAKVVVGDDVVTSHLGNIYPPGIMIGKIVSIEQSPHRMTKQAILEPVVDFKHLEEVLIINMLWDKSNK